MTEEKREKRKKYFCQLSYRLNDEGIIAALYRYNPAALAIYFVLSSLQECRTSFTCPVKDIQKFSGVSKNKIANAVRMLQRMGLIEVKRAGPRLHFMNIYSVKPITPETTLTLSCISSDRYKSKDMARGQDGRFGGPPVFKDKASPQETSCIIPEFTEQSNEGAANSGNAESCSSVIAESRIIPGNRDEVVPSSRNTRINNNIDRKEIREGGLKADLSLSKPNPASPDSLKRKKSLGNVTNEILITLKNTLGGSKALKYRLLKDGYPAEEVESLSI